jgi:tetratricopeptide (TPR) repeat protein
MAAAALTLPTDLLQQVRGIERGLLRRRRVSAAGGFATVILAALEAALVVSNRTNGVSWGSLVGKAPVLVPAFLVFLSLFAVSWSRYWLKESRSPFRYTFSVGDFECEVASEWSEDKLGWLRHDLTELLSQRIGRLSVLDERTATGGPPSAPALAPEGGSHQTDVSHIHVGGTYVVRERPRRPDSWLIEITPWVRVGSSQAAALLAHSVRFSLKGQGPGIPTEEYGRIRERVFFSVASQIYAQIREDVQRKIDLLPTKRFRAIAYFFEAEDYARSNTLDAYDAAKELYAAAIALYLSSWHPLSAVRWRRELQHVRRSFGYLVQRTRLLASYMWPRLGKMPVLLSRAQVGYANMLLYRRTLASMSGQRLNPVFEARPVTVQAIDRLQALPDYVPRQRETLFEAYVSLALTWVFMRSRRRARSWLSEAAGLLPARAEEDSRYLFASGMAEPRVLSKLPLFRRAVELDPEFEVAQFQLALNAEKLWRTRPTLEATVATRFVLEYYEEAVRLNPGNISAWGSIGYIAWLLEDDDAAVDAFESGLEYKDIKRDTFVAELDLGLARIAAERGCFEAAFYHYRNAAIEEVSQGNAYRGPSGYTGYHFEALGLPMLRRFLRYRYRVEKGLREAGPGKLPRRVVDALRGYVLADFADASWNYYLRSGDRRMLVTAHRAYVKACRLNPEDVLPYYRLYFLLSEVLDVLLPQVAKGGSAASFSHVERLASLEYRLIRRVVDLEPLWLDGRLALALEEAALRQPDLSATLPHAWLWKYNPSDGQTFDFRTLRRLRVWRDQRWWRWEREFDEVNVRSLLALAQVMQRRAGHSPSSSGFLLIGKRRPSREERQAQRLFGHIQWHFFPDDFDILRLIPEEGRSERLGQLARRWISDDAKTKWALAGQARAFRTRQDDKPGASAARPADEMTRAMLRDLWARPQLVQYAYRALPRSYRVFRFAMSREAEPLKNLPGLARRSGMCLAVREWLANAPQPYWALHRLTASDGQREALFDPDEQATTLRSALMEDVARSPALYRWLGDRLLDLGQKEDAVLAYNEGVANCRDGLLLHDLGRSLAKLHRDADARVALQKAIRWGARRADSRRRWFDAWLPLDDPIPGSPYAP